MGVGAPRRTVLHPRDARQPVSMHRVFLNRSPLEWLPKEGFPILRNKLVVAVAGCSVDEPMGMETVRDVACACV